MQSFDIGDRVRKNLTSGVWTVNGYDKQNNTYVIHREVSWEKLDYPMSGTIVYNLGTQQRIPIHNVTEYTFILAETVKPNDIQKVPDDRTLKIQQYLDITDSELSVLRKIEKLNSEKSFPLSIPNVVFDAKEFNSIQSLIEKQYWFYIGEDSLFGKGDFLSQNDDNVLLLAEITPILRIYKDYIIS